MALTRTLAIAAALAAGFAACAPPTPATPTTIETPAAPRTNSRVEVAVVESVRAYLHTFKLDEKNLAVGLAIPWAEGGEWGVARATGNFGPGGHRIYEVRRLSSASSGLVENRQSMEIAPEEGP
jgi:hypothetical protein